MIVFQGATPLHIAAAEDRLGAITELLEASNIDVNQAYTIPSHSTGMPSNATPLHIAAALGNLYAVKILLRDPRTNATAINGAGYTALHIATQSGNTEITEALLSDKRVRLNA